MTADTITRIEHKLDALGQKQEEQGQALAVHSMTLTNHVTEEGSTLRLIRKDGADVRRMLLGNGKIGLCEQVRDNRNDIDRLLSQGQALLRFGWVTLGGAALGVAGFLANLIVAYLQEKGPPV